jgi:hypothetical protein
MAPSCVVNLYIGGLRNPSTYDTYSRGRGSDRVILSLPECSLRPWPSSIHLHVTMLAFADLDMLFNAPPAKQKHVHPCDRGVIRWQRIKDAIFAETCQSADPCRVDYEKCRRLLDSKQKENLLSPRATVACETAAHLCGSTAAKQLPHGRQRSRRDKWRS